MGNALGRYLARSYVTQWARAVEIQNERVHASLDPVTGEPGPNTIADVDLFVVALRDLLRAARFAAEESSAPEITAAITEFDEQVPAAARARDMIEHFDEYARGRGRRQIEEPELIGVPLYAAASITSTEPDGEAVKRPSLVIVIGGEQIALAPATRAAQRVADQILRALAGRSSS